MAGNNPLKEVIGLKKQGMNDSGILNNLKNKYDSNDISDAMAQANIKNNVEYDDEVPSPGEMQSSIMAAPEEEYTSADVQAPESTPMPSQPQIDINERIHEISEAIVNEKWEEFLGKVGDLPIWKERVNSNITAIKQEIIRMGERFDNLEKAILGKVGDYGKGIEDIHTEMKALEKVFEKILDPLVSNVKELERITAKLKQGK